MLTMNPIDPHTAKKALASYFKGLIQDYYHETGQKVSDIKINGKIDNNTWRVDSVEIMTDLEMPLFNDIT